MKQTLKEQFKEVLLIIFIVLSFSTSVLFAIYRLNIDIRAKQAIIELNEKTK